MRRRKAEKPDSLLFNGKVYESDAERDAAREAQRERRRRLIERLNEPHVPGTRGYDGRGRPL